MNPSVDEELLNAVNSIGPTTWSGRCFRFAIARRDPLSGEGARVNGGRWNPPGLFPVVYLAQPIAACMRELEKQAEDNHLDVATQLQVAFMLHTIDVVEIPVLDLTSQVNRDQLGLEEQDLHGQASWQACQPVGHAAWFLDFGGVLAPSATGSGLTLALFEHRVGPHQVQRHGSVSLTEELYLESVG